MSASGSSLAQVLATHTEDDVLQAVALYLSLCPHVCEPLVNILNEPPAQRYTGQITKFFPDKMYGFIQSPEITNEYGRDVFCSSEELGDFTVGQEVSFSIVLNKNNQPQARLLKDSNGTLAASTMTESAAKRQRTDQWYPFQGQSFEPVVVPAPRRTQPAAALPDIQHVTSFEDRSSFAPAASEPYIGAEPTSDRSQRYFGSIKQFSPEKNFGFISSQAAHASYGRDVFLSSMEIGEFAVGDSVSFDIALNKNGHPQARNLERRFVGSIKQFDAEKHFGFITCPAASESFGGRDVFLSSMEIKAFAVGDSVSFDVVLNKKGHPQARNLEAAVAM